MILQWEWADNSSHSLFPMPTYLYIHVVKLLRSAFLRERGYQNSLMYWSLIVMLVNVMCGRVGEWEGLWSKAVPVLADPLRCL